MTTEQGVLRFSIIMTFVLAGFGILFGLLSGSVSIVFDGLYALTDASMAVLSLLVTNLIAASTAGGPTKSKLVANFTMGFWHLEPMVLGLNGTLLIGASIYALINAIGSLMSGGRVLNFDLAIVDAVVTVALSIGMALYGMKANKAIRSDFLAMDAKAWVMSAALTAALLVAFIFGYFIQGTRLQWMSPYVDPAILAVVCLVVIPIPFGTVRRALADILLVTPAELKQHVDEVAEVIVARYGFLSYRSYVARVGRGRQIELYFIVPTGWPAKRLEEWDRIRDEISEAIGGDTADRWLTIVFTTDEEWAEGTPREVIE